MKVSDIQQAIFDQTGIKTSVKKCRGSMKTFLAFTPMFQNGIYPTFPFEWLQCFKKSVHCKYLSFFVIGQIHIQIAEFTDLTPINYKREAKPKTIEEMTQRTWGSKNSQLRLDKAASRYAKRSKNGNTVRYW